MPFPLAHPAAILPLRRYCPRFLSLPALVVGSIAPDLGYFLARLHVDEPAHRLLGSVVFCLPVGFLVLALYHGLRKWILRKAPGACPPALQPLLRLRLGTPLAVAISLLLGAWSHLALDSFTHKDGWITQQLPALRMSVGTFAGHSVRVCSLLWYGFSFVGVAIVFAAFRDWQRRELSPAPGAQSVQPKARWLGPILVASVVLPIELVHHLAHGWAGMTATALMTLGLVAFVLWNVRSPGPAGSSDRLRARVGSTTE